MPGSAVDTSFVIATCAVVGVLVEAAGGLVWAVRLEGRVKANEQLAERDRAEIFTHLRRIESKLDRALEE